MNATQLAINQARDATRNWYDDCYRFAAKWVRRKKGRFSSEDIIQAFERKHDFRPSERRVWGAVMRQLKADGLIRWVCYGKAKLVSSHQKPINIWQSK